MAFKYLASAPESMVDLSAYQSPGREKHRPAFRSRLIDRSQPSVKERFYQTPVGKRSKRLSEVAFFLPMLLGLGGAAALLVSSYLSLSRDKFCLVLDEQFDQPELNLRTWTVEQEIGGFGNNQFDWTTDSKDNLFIDNGKLYIVPTLTNNTISEEDMLNGFTVNLTESGTCTGLSVDSCVKTSANTPGNATMIPPIQSARINTNYSTAIKYGRVEVKARMPRGDWLWPAIWLMPKDSVYGEWPRSGEIDIAEGRGNRPKKRDDKLSNAISSTLHWGPEQQFDGWYKTTGLRKLYQTFFDDKSHVFGLDWTPDAITTWEGTPVRKVLSRNLGKKFGGFWKLGKWDLPSSVNPWSSGTNAAPFDQEFFLILNVAVGGTNQYFSDTEFPNKPWSNMYPQNAAIDFWNNVADWLPSWPTDPKQRGMEIEYVKMYSRC